MKSAWILLSAILISISWSCDKKNDDLVKPLSAEEFPQIIQFDDEGDGDIEDADEFSFKLTLNDRPDPSGEEPAGMIIPLSADVKVSFEVKEWEGFDHPANYITGVKAFYEIDDCTTSEDEGIDLNIMFDAATGKGSVTFPKDVEEIEIVFETDEDYFNDGDLNDTERSITLMVTGIESGLQNVSYNREGSFKYEVLDEEGVHGDWELDHTDPAQFAAFKELFGTINDDIASLEATDIDKIEISIEYNEVKVVVELTEQELIEDCDGPEMVNKIIEIEADLEELTQLAPDGDIEFVGEVEQPDGSTKEFVYKGSFMVVGENLEITLVREYDDQESDEITLELKK